MQTFEQPPSSTVVYVVCTSPLMEIKFRNQHIQNIFCWRLSSPAADAIALMKIIDKLFVALYRKFNIFTLETYILNDISQAYAISWFYTIFVVHSLFTPVPHTGRTIYACVEGNSRENREDNKNT